jgi:hypothetical protein
MVKEFNKKIQIEQKNTMESKPSQNGTSSKKSVSNIKEQPTHPQKKLEPPTIPSPIQSSTPLKNGTKPHKQIQKNGNEPQK